MNSNRCIGILHIKSAVIYGISKNGKTRKFLFTPIIKNKLKTDKIQISSSINPYYYKNNIYVIINNGTLSEILGEVGDINTEQLVRIYYNNLDCCLKNKHIHLPISISDLSILNRKDLTQLYTFSIDPDGCKDIDDAISYQKNNNMKKIYIHIADVSSWLHMYGESLEDRIKQQISTIYTDIKTYNLLPKELSENYCSLLENVKRLAYTLIIYIDKDIITNYEFCETVIINKLQTTYDKQSTSLMYELSDTLKQLNNKRNEKYFSKLNCNSNSISSIPHYIVDTLMIMANVCCAETLITQNNQWNHPIILKTHSDMDYNKYKQMSDILYTNSINSNISHNNELSEYIYVNSQVKSEYKLITSQDMLENVKHFGLSVKYYTHFTSPIRRYIDIINHRQLKGETNICINQELCDHANHINTSLKRLKRDLNYFKIKELTISEGYVTEILPYIRIWIPQYDIQTKIHNQQSLQQTLSLFTKYKIKIIPNLNSEHFTKKLLFEIMT